MRVRLLPLVHVWILFAACTGPPTAAPDPAPTATLTPSPSATASQLPTRAPIAGVPVNAILSPDGKFFAVTDQNALRLRILGLDGAAVRQATGFFNRLTWLPDSSGILFESSAPQRAGPLGIFELDGRVVHTELQHADTVISLDGRTVAAAHQEGCCVAIVQREIRASPRSGGPARVLVRSTAPAALPGPLTILGVAADGRILFRDDQRFGLIDFDGSRSQDVPKPGGLDASRLFAFESAPDRTAILLRTYEPFSWWMYSNGAVRPLPAAVEPVTTVRRSATWLPGALLVNEAGGRLGALDVATLTVRALPIVLPPPVPQQPPQPPVSVAFAAGNGRLLWLDRPRLRVTDLATGAATDAGLSVSDAAEVQARALPGGGFVVWTRDAVYRLEAGP